MRKMKLMVIGAAIIASVALVPVSVFAASDYTTPAEAVAGLTGRTVQSVIDERKDTGKTYGKIADEAGKLEEFKKESLEMRKDSLAQQVKDGKITQERADEIIKAITENQQTCDGSGSAAIGRNSGAGFGCGGQGCGNGNGQGRGAGNGSGRGAGNGMGRGNGNGVCRVA